MVQRNDRDADGKKILTTETIVISVIAMVSLIIVAVVGIFAVFKNSRQLLLLVSTRIFCFLCLFFIPVLLLDFFQWCVIMGVMFLFGVIQLILFFVNAGIIVPKDKDYSGKEQSIFLTATILVMIVAVIGFVFGFLLRWRVVRKKASNGKGLSIL